jgi:hypothetical protein
MKYVFKTIAVSTFAAFALINLNSCGKDSPAGPADPCAGKTIIISATPTASSGCASNGSIAVSATGSSGFTFKLNSGGAYQASGDFINLAPGTYSIFAKDAAGCERSTTANITSGTAGPLFSLVKTLMAAKCQSCHNNSVQNGGVNWAVDCNIVSSKDRIKVRAVDEGTMPVGAPLTTGEKAIITNWITAGGLLTN